MATGGKNNDLVIAQKYTELIAFALQAIKKFSKTEKYSMGKDIKASLFSALRNILLANKTFSSSRRMDILNVIDAEIQFQKIMVRIAHDEKLIDHKKYIAWEKMLDEIGRLLGGWMKATNMKLCHEKPCQEK